MKHGSTITHSLCRTDRDDEIISHLAEAFFNTIISKQPLSIHCHMKYQGQAQKIYGKGLWERESYLGKQRAKTTTSVSKRAKVDLWPNPD